MLPAIVIQREPTSRTAFLAEELIRLKESSEEKKEEDTVAAFIQETSAPPPLVQDNKVYIPKGKCYEEYYHYPTVFTRTQSVSFVYTIRAWKSEAIVDVIQPFVEGRILIDSIPPKEFLKGPCWVGLQPLKMIRFYVHPAYVPNSVNLEFRRIMKEIGGATEVKSAEEANWIIDSIHTEWKRLIELDENSFLPLAGWFFGDLPWCNLSWQYLKTIPALVM